MVSLGAVGARPELELRPPVPAWTTESTLLPLSQLSKTPVPTGAGPTPCQTPDRHSSTEQWVERKTEGLYAGTSMQAMQQKLHREPKACTGAAQLLGSGHARLGKPMPCSQERPGDCTFDRSHARVRLHLRAHRKTL